MFAANFLRPKIRFKHFVRSCKLAMDFRRFLSAILVDML